MISTIITSVYDLKYKNTYKIQTLHTFLDITLEILINSGEVMQLIRFCHLQLSHLNSHLIQHTYLIMNLEAPHAHIDKNALSRQLAVYGAETQSKLMAMRVMLIGLRGVGIEVAKNLILAGPKKVGLFDPTPVRI